MQLEVSPTYCCLHFTQVITSRLRNHAKLSDSDKERDDLIYKHFNSPGHNGLVDVSIKTH